jgi:hypothetical protein
MADGVPPQHLVQWGITPPLPQTTPVGVQAFKISFGEERIEAILKALQNDSCVLDNIFNNFPVSYQSTGNGMWIDIWTIIFNKYDDGYIGGINVLWQVSYTSLRVTAINYFVLLCGWALFIKQIIWILPVVKQ